MEIIEEDYTEQLNIMYWDAKVEGTINPILKLYYFLRMKGLEYAKRNREK